MDAGAGDQGLGVAGDVEDGDFGAGGVGGDLHGEEDAVGVIVGLALGEGDVDLLVAVEVGDGDAEAALGVGGGEGAGLQAEVAAAVVEDEAVVVAEQAGDDEVGVAVGVDVEEGDHVVVAGDVGVGGPELGGGVVEAAHAVAEEDVLGVAGAVVDGDEVDEVVAVEVDRLELVVVAELGQLIAGVGELAGAVVVEQEGAAAGLAGDEDVEVVIVVDVGEVHLPRPGDLDLRHVGGGGVGEGAGAVAEPQLGDGSLGAGVPGAPVGEDDVEVAVGVDVGELEVADAGHLLGDLGGVVGEVALAVAEVQPALVAEAVADDEVDVAVAVDVTGLDDAGLAGHREHLGADVLEGLAGALVEEDAALLGALGGAVAGAVGDEDVDQAVAVDVGELELVGPLLGDTDRAGGGVLPGGREGDARETEGQERESLPGTHARAVPRTAARVRHVASTRASTRASYSRVMPLAWQTDWSCFCSVASSFL